MDTNRCLLTHLTFCSIAPQTPPVLSSCKRQLVSFYRHKHLTCVGSTDCDADMLCWPAPFKATVLYSPLTCDADLGRPFRGAIEHALFDLLHMGDMSGLGDSEHFLNEFKDLRFVPLADLHAVLQNHNDVLGSVLRAMFRALLCSSWLMGQLRKGLDM